MERWVVCGGARAGGTTGRGADMRLRVVSRGVGVVEVDGGGSGVAVLQPIVLAHRGAC